MNKRKALTSLIAVLFSFVIIVFNMFPCYEMNSFAGDYVVFDDGYYTYYLYDDYAELAYCVYQGVSGEVIIPNEIQGLPVKSIKGGALSSCSQITSIVIPDSVERIGMGAFQDCRGLSSITLPDCITSISNLMFSGCYSLRSIVLPHKVQSIGQSAFMDCKLLKNIEFPDGLLSIGDSAFWRCESLTSFTIPDSVISIGGGAFSETRWFNLQQAQDPLVVLNNIVLDGQHCSGNVILPYGITSISDYAFMNSRITSITMPDTVTYIGKSAFSSCMDLVKVNISEKVNTIAETTFSGCSSLISVILPVAVKKIEEKAFYNCEKLERVEILNPMCEIADSLYTIGNGYESNKGDFYYNYKGLICGYSNSTAQSYAEDWKYTFESLGEPPEEEKQLGDIDGDSVIDSSDASLVLVEYSATQTGAEPTVDKAVGDVNKDGVIDSSDASDILQYFAFIQTGGNGSFTEFLQTL